MSVNGLPGQDPEHRSFGADVPTRDAEDRPESAQTRPIPTLTLAFHPELRRLGEVSVCRGLADGQPCEISRLFPLFSHLPDDPEGRPLGDPFLSRTPVLLQPRSWGLTVVAPEGGVRVRVDGQDLLEGRDLTWEELDAGVVLELGGRAVLVLSRRVAHAPPGDDLGIVGRSPSIEQLRRELRLAAGRELPTFLRGETGTGKELVASAIHRLSARAGRPFVSVNMAAIPVATAVSQLFGHVRGAFTGALFDHPGFFAQADGGTLFLDEVGEMPAEVQVTLLRVLESGEIQPVGGRRPRMVDVRLISATDSDIGGALQRGNFRSSLYHRLSGFVITMPSLRARREDIPRLLLHFLVEEQGGDGTSLAFWGRAEDPQPRLSADLMTRALLHPWPGNVRELRNFVRRLVVSRDLPPEQLVREALSLLDMTSSQAVPFVADEPDGCASPEEINAPKIYLGERLEFGSVLATLRAHSFQIGAAARALSVSRTTLYAFIDRCPELRKAGDLTRDEILGAMEQVGVDTRALAMHLEVSHQGLARRLRELGL